MKRNYFKFFYRKFNTEWNANVTFFFFFIIEEGKETILNFFQRTVKVF